VAAATEQQHRLTALVTGPDGLDQIRLGVHGDEPARRAADPQRGPAGQDGVVLDVHTLTAARARPSTFCPSNSVLMSISAVPSASLTEATTALISSSAPASSSGTGTGL